MIDIVINEKKPESRAEKLKRKYIKIDGYEHERLMALRDISVTLAMILDEMRGVKDGK